ncbi:MAG: flagellar protein FliS [Desulfovibrio sp.]|nr:flagellar protein FliS [Desulfovibrio sp.]
MATILPFKSRSAEEPGWLLLHMYDEALFSMKNAGICMGTHDYPGKARHISRAISIFYELTCSLNDRSDNLARNLDSIYLTCTAKLVRASADMDTAPLTSARNMVVELRDAVAAAIPSMPKKGRRARILPFTANAVTSSPRE